MSLLERPLNADAIRAELHGSTIGRDVLVLDETTSTNEFLFGIANASTSEGLVVFAEHQTAGRGQHGKRWESPRGKGLWFSVLLRPDISPNESPRLTSWAARTIAETIATNYSLGANVKPPNDVVANGRKLAGVLLEMRVPPGAAHIGILGVGVNVNQAVDDFPEELRGSASSIAMLLGREIDRNALAITLLRALDRSYRDTAAS